MVDVRFVTIRLAASLSAAVLVASVVTAQNGPPLPPAENRSVDGSGNNLNDPTLGAPISLLERLDYSGIPNITGNNAYADGISAPARTGPGHVSPRVISNLLGAQSVSIPNDRGLNDMWLIFGALFAADTGQPVPNFSDPLPISVATGDPVFDPSGTGSVTLGFFRSLGVQIPQREHLNVVNTWFDMSPTYGGEPQRAALLRSGERGRLLSEISANGEELLPTYGFLRSLKPVDAPTVLASDEFQAFPNRDRFFVGGIPGINIFTFSTVLPTVFLREHNRVAGAIHGLKPGEKESIGVPPVEQANRGAYDEAIYQLARKIVTAEMQSITYHEYLPALGVELSPYTGYNDTAKPDLLSEFTTALFRFPHSMQNSLFLRLKEDGRAIPSGHFPVPVGIFNPELVHADGVDAILRGLLVQTAQEVDLKVIDGLRNIAVPGLFADLLADDIQRGRDRGIPDYNSVRRAVGLPSVAGFSELTSDPPTLAALAAAYPSGIASLDPFVGILLEPHVPGSSLGVTGKRLFARQAEKTRDSDRFWYQNQLTFDPRLRRALRLLGFSLRTDDSGYEILNCTWASVLVGTSAIGREGFPLTAQSTAFFSIQP
jgi:hypothetical protein